MADLIYRLKILNPDRRLSLSTILLMVCIGRLSLQPELDPWLSVCLIGALLNYNVKRMTGFVKRREHERHKERMALIEGNQLSDDDKLRKQVDEIERELRGLIMGMKSGF